MKVLISADMEGISGVVDWTHVTPGHAEYERHRRSMTIDVNAAIAGAFDGGATEVVVTDSHWYGTNILLDELDPRASLNSGLSAPMDMLQGIDQGVEALILVGYHGSMGAERAVLNHTWNFVRVREVRINSRVFGEIGLNAARAGCFGVPVVAVSGDQTACSEAKDFIGTELATAVVKTAYGESSAECVSMTRSRELIRGAAKSGVSRAKEHNGPAPFTVDGPIHLEVELTTTLGADRASIMPGTSRLSGTRLGYEAENMLVAFNAFKSLVAISRD